MRTFSIALASALLLTYLVVEVLSKFFPGETGYLVLGSALAIALFINGLFNARLATTGNTPKRKSNNNGRNQNRNGRGNRAGKGRREDERRGRNNQAA